MESCGNLKHYSQDDSTAYVDAAVGECAQRAVRPVSLGEVGALSVRKSCENTHENAHEKGLFNHIVVVCAVVVAMLLQRRKIPWKLLIHVLLTVVMSVGVFTDASSWASYMISTQENFCYFFFPEGCKDDMCGAAHSMLFEECRVYSIDDVYDSIDAAVNNYYSISKYVFLLQTFRPLKLTRRCIP